MSERAGGVRELEEVLEDALRSLSADVDTGAKSASLGVWQRYRFPDIDLVLQVGPDAEGAVTWEFGETDREVRLELTMDSEVANRYFQGAESAPIAIARGKITVSCHDYLAALRAFPGNRALFASYRDVIHRSYPHLELRAPVVSEPVATA